MITPSDINTLTSSLPKLHVLVIGDLMLDRYLWGSVTRISPEAPVPVVDVDRTEVRLGGAANVALNLGSMGAQVSVCGVIGNDENGLMLMSCLSREGFDTRNVLQTDSRPTTTKTRVIGNNQQILRIDQEVREEIGADLRAKLLEDLLKDIHRFQAIIFEDYDKGMLGPDLIQAVMQAAKTAGIPTIVDPKYRNFLAYGGATLFKPNLKELNEALNLRLSKNDIQGIAKAVISLREKMPHAQTLVTLSENGVLTVNSAGQWKHLGAHYRKITDVSGAGDTVVAVMALCLAAGVKLESSAIIANLAGGLVCEEVGVVPINLQRLLGEARGLIRTL
jgi:D-glycero-beta-D-manno-heptose-7-phosphate kinase